MTEAIKQWMWDEEYKHNSSDSPNGFAAGLEKGIEIAEGFPEWRDNMIATEKHYYFLAGIKYAFTTSQLLEKYLKTLEP